MIPGYLGGGVAGREPNWRWHQDRPDAGERHGQNRPTRRARAVEEECQVQAEAETRGKGEADPPRRAGLWPAQQDRVRAPLRSARRQVDQGRAVGWQDPIQDRAVYPRHRQPRRGADAGRPLGSRPVRPGHGRAFAHGLLGESRALPAAGSVRLHRPQMRLPRSQRSVPRQRREASGRRAARIGDRSGHPGTDVRCRATGLPARTGPRHVAASQDRGGARRARRSQGNLRPACQGPRRCTAARHDRPDRRHGAARRAGLPVRPCPSQADGGHLPGAAAHGWRAVRRHRAQPGLDDCLRRLAPAEEERHRRAAVRDHRLAIGIAAGAQCVQEVDRQIQTTVPALRQPVAECCGRGRCGGAGSRPRQRHRLVGRHQGRLQQYRHRACRARPQSLVQRQCAFIHGLPDQQRGAGTGVRGGGPGVRAQPESAGHYF